ncbi:MAG: cation diffusion facilitator family transporter [Pyrinomonadaceae bacterium]|nr:cation diffusion facilitator family transporter [Pyrinomonadaceae bacterium]
MINNNLTRYAWLSIAAAIATITLKSGAYLVTGSVGLLSDALESIINLVAAVIALWVLKIAAQPPDEGHTYGHGKVEYFSSGIEGAMIILAAVSICYAAIERLLHPQPLEQIGIGLLISIIATAINFIVARILLRAGKENHSIVLEADGHHLMSDVWTTIGVIFGIGLVYATGWWRLDPIMAILVAINILWSGGKLINRSVQGLLDAALPKDIHGKIVEILDSYVKEDEIDYHALRTRQAGTYKFINVHILVPGKWTVEQGHDLIEEIEGKLRSEIRNSVVFTHLEPIESPVSYEDIDLIRAQNQ